MKLYGNRRKSGVENFEIGADFIEIKFKKSPEIYPYTYELDGVEAIEEMKNLALRGKGLNTYISKYVKRRFR